MQFIYKRMTTLKLDQFISTTSTVHGADTASSSSSLLLQRRVFLKMSKPNTIAWSSWEKNNLFSWLLQRQKMTWKAKSKAYFKQFGLKRTGEALRSKRNYLLRKRRAMLKSMSKASFTGHRPWIPREDTPRAFPPPPPIFTPRARSTETCRLSHMRQSLAASTGRYARGALGSAGQALPGYTIRMPHNLKPDHGQDISYLWKFVHLAATTSKASRNAAI
ncbi:unnamed protein product [Penicillium nalgiovense]|uniref:Uncharacterized protein n=3 Tax=Penicillium TaxID=5073 RepID=A0A9W4MTU7_PENNA|nr:unnamed protein product [Penicillium nalgiovense]CAG7951972.1 unnamed protein product [Penicillium salamii]CRL30757.1 unnamed protein product [Penicillium camemberti]CAG7966604.1 unnamed protein product [Penicillium salamii]CAG7994875.1 unnamed protein product [Penicillium salamii]